MAMFLNKTLMGKKLIILLDDKNISDLAKSFCNPQDQPYELACKINSFARNPSSLFFIILVH